VGALGDGAGGQAVAVEHQDGARFGHRKLPHDEGVGNVVGAPLGAAASYLACVDEPPPPDRSRTL